MMPKVAKNAAAERYQRAIHRSARANQQADACLAKAIATEARIKRRSAAQMQKKALQRLRKDLGTAKAAIASGDFFVRRKNGISLWLLPDGRGPLRAAIVVNHDSTPPPPPPPCDLMASLKISAPSAAGQHGGTNVCFRCYIELFDKQPVKCGRCLCGDEAMEE